MKEKQTHTNQEGVAKKNLRKQEILKKTLKLHTIKISLNLRENGILWKNKWGILLR